MDNKHPLTKEGFKVSLLDIMAYLFPPGEDTKDDRKTIYITAPFDDACSVQFELDVQTFISGAPFDNQLVYLLQLRCIDAITTIFREQQKNTLNSYYTKSRHQIVQQQKIN